MNNPNSQVLAKILLVDDNQDNLRLLSRVLRTEGYQTRQINRSQEVMPAVKENRPDLIFLDISMPEMNGYEVCRCLKSDKRTRDIPVIFMSASDDVIDKSKAFSVGGANFIKKPVSIDEVIKQIETHAKIGKFDKSNQTSNPSLRKASSQSPLARMQAAMKNSQQIRRRRIWSRQSERKKN